MNHPAFLTIGCATIGAVVGAMTMWFTIKDRMVREVEAQVTDRVRNEARWTRHDERIKSLEDTIRTIRQPANTPAQ
jgi:Flp pilus assembly protein TadB